MLEILIILPDEFKYRTVSNYGPLSNCAPLQSFTAQKIVKLNIQKSMHFSY